MRGISQVTYLAQCSAPTDLTHQLCMRQFHLPKSTPPGNGGEDHFRGLPRAEAFGTEASGGPKRSDLPFIRAGLVSARANVSFALPRLSKSPAA